MGKRTRKKDKPFSEEDAFQDALEKNPKDTLLRLVFAGWLEDRGDVRWEGYLAMARRGLYAVTEGKTGCPYFLECIQHKAYDSLSYAFLPDDWFELIDSPHKDNGLFPWWDIKNDMTRREVEDAAALAFSKLPPERRAELLSVSPVED